MEEDWMCDENNGNKQFAGESVQKFLKKELKASYGYSRVQDGYMQFFRTVEDADAFDQGDTSKLLHQDELSGKTNVEFRFQNMPSGNVYINGNNPYYFPLYVKSVAQYSDGTEEPFDTNISLAILVNLNGSTTTTELGTFPANETFRVNITPYVADGASFVFLAYNEAGNRRTSGRYSVIRATLSLGTQNDTWWGTAFRQGDANWNVPLALNVNVGCELRATLSKGGTTYVSKTVPSSEFSSNYALKLNHPISTGGVSGVYQLHLELVATDETVSGMEPATLDFDIFCVSADDTNCYFVTNNVASELQNYTNNKVFEYAVFVGSGNHTLTIEAETDGAAVVSPSTTAAVNGTVSSYYLNLELERADNADFTINVTARIDDGADVMDEDFTTTNTLGYAATAGATLLVKANGRSNSEADREKLINVLTGEEVKRVVDGDTHYPEWTNMTWSSVDGYMTKNVTDRNGDSVTVAFIRLLSGETLEIPITPLAMRASEGRTFEIMFQCRNVMNYDTPIIQCLDESGNSFVGLKVTSSKVTLLTNNSQDEDTQSKNFDPDDLIHLAIVVNPAYTEAGRQFNACFIYINGNKQRVFAYDRDINVLSDLLIGCADADIDIYGIRTYDNALTSDEIVTNAVNWQISLYDKQYMKERNNIKQNGKVDFNKVRALCNVFVFKANDGSGNVPTLGWGKDDTISGRLKTYWRDEPTWNSQTDCELQGQGTSSMEYFRWNFKSSLSVAWAFDGGTHPSIKKWCAKKNFASSMQCHKMGGTEAYDYLARACGAVPQNAARQAIWQYPFVGFAEKVENGQSVYEFIGLYTVGPDKGDKDTFGFTSDSIAMEGLDNDRLSTNFRVPWNDSTVEPDSKNEKYNVCGEKAWEDSMKNPTGVLSRWKPAYNLVYECSQLIKPWKGITFDGDTYAATLEGLLSYGEAIADIDTSTDEGKALYKDATMYEYWISGSYDLYRYDPQSGEYVQSYTTAAINLSTALCGHNYQVGTENSGGQTVPVYLTTELLAAAADDDARNVLLKKARLSKFKAEVGNHFDITNAFFHLAWVEFNAATDNLAKNTYPYLLACSDDTDRIRWRQDDVDTVWPIDNQGKDKKPYCVELEDNYSDYGLASLWVWNGRYSQFWYTLKEAFATEYETFVRGTFFQALHYGNGTNLLQRIMAFFQHFYFDRAQEYFGAALYNADSVYCYEQAYLYEGTYTHKGIALEQALGDHYSAEKYWIRMRTIYMMSKYKADLFMAGQTTDCFATRVGEGVNTYNITPAIYMYPVVQNGEQAIQGPRFWPGSNVQSWTAGPITTAGDQTFRINGMSYIRDIGNLYQNTLKESVSVAGSMLRVLMLGNHEAQAEDIKSTVTAVTIDNATSLRKIDLGKLGLLAGTVNLTSCINAREIYGGDTAIASLVLSNGGPLTTLVLGERITTLQLLGKQMLTTLTIGSTDRLTSVEMANCNAYTISRIMSILAGVQTSQLTSVKLAFGTVNTPSVLTDADIAVLLAINAADIDTKQFSGYITKSSGTISGSTYGQLEAMNITYIGDVDPEVSISSNDVTITGNACTVFSGESATFLARVVPAATGTPRFRLYNGNTAIEEVGGVATYNGVTLNCATGVLETTVTSVPFTVKVSAYVGAVESSKVTVTVDKTVLMGGFTVSGTKTYTASGDNTLQLVPTNSDYTVGAASIDIVVTQNGESAARDEYLRVTVNSLADLQLKAAVLGIPRTSREYSVKVTVTDVKGNVYERTETLTVQAIPVTSFAIGGADTITAAGNYNYTIGSILPANYNIGIATIAVNAGSYTATVDGTNGFSLAVPEMPAQTENLTITVTATLVGGGNVVATKAVQLKVGGAGGETVMTINQGITDAATMITRDANATDFATWLRENTHRYLGKKSADGQMTICQLKDDDSTKYADGSTAALDGTEGDVFVRLPEFYYKCTSSETDKWTIALAWGSKPDNTYKTWNDGRLLGAYEAYMTNNKLYSRSGVQSANNINRNNFKTYARARGTGYSLVTWEWHCIMAVLYYALYGHTNCQNQIGKGTSSYEKATGQTNSLGMEDTVANGNGETMSINFLGAENWWGNKYEFIDNADVQDYVWTITDIENGNTTRNAGTASNTSSQWISKMIFGEFIDLIPTAVAGSETTGFCDKYYCSSGSRVVLRSCSYADSYGGVAYVGANVDSSYTNAYCGSRLAFSGVIVEASDVATFKAIQVTN